MKNISTFSIVARDAASGDLGIAVQSKFLAVGNGVLWAKAGVGAVVTQALANMDFGELGLHILEKGYGAERTARALIQLNIYNLVKYLTKDGTIHLDMSDEITKSPLDRKSVV